MHGGQRDAVRSFETRSAKVLQQRRWPFNASLGYFAGLGLPVLPEISKVGLWPAIQASFLSSGLQTVVTALAIAVVIVYAVALPIVESRLAKRTLDRSLLTAFDSFVDPVFLAEHHQLEGIAWGLGQTVLASPRPAIGWPTTAVKLRVNRSLYSFQNLEDAGLDGLAGRDLDAEYQAFLRDEFPQQFGSDGEKWMLVRRPHSFSDDSVLNLDVQATRWSQLQFLWQKLAPGNMDVLYPAALDRDPIPYPTSLCLHLLVFSREGRLLLTLTHRTKSNDYADTWACSIGEQLASEDVPHPDQDCAKRWVLRALDEELAIEPDELDQDQIRFLALTFEGDIANVAMVCAVHLHLSEHDVTARLKTANRPDNEFAAVDFIDLDDIPSELVNPSRPYHPSTGIRMIYAYLHVRGQHDLRRRLSNLVAARSS